MSSPKNEEMSNIIGGKVDEGVPGASDDDAVNREKRAKTIADKVKGQFGAGSAEESKADAVE